MILVNRLRRAKVRGRLDLIANNGAFMAVRKAME